MEAINSVYRLVNSNIMFNRALYFVTGVYYTMAVVGPALGYVLGGQMLNIYTDFATVDSET